MIAKKNNVKSYKLVFLGDTSVGKSCISMRYINKDFHEFQEPTIGAAFLSKNININNRESRLDIWDTAGQERYRSLAPMYYRGAQGAFVVYDITNEDSFIGAKNWVKELQKKVPECIIILLGNKCDLNSKVVPDDEVKQYCNENAIQFLLTSAKTGENVESAFSLMIEKLPKLEQNNIIIDDNETTNLQEKISCC
jgi:small GTP-binding protein